MRVSQFEIYRLIQRSMEALGAGYGVDRDAARAAAWLEARGLPGLLAFADTLPRLEAGLPTPRLVRQSEGEIEIVLSGPAIACAGAMLDLVVGQWRRSGRSQLRIGSCTAPLYLIPGAIEAAIPLSLTWPTARGDVRAAVDNCSVPPVASSGLGLR